MSGPLAGIEIQPILLDRIERYRARHCIATLGDAVERLVRRVLFTDAMPDGSQLVRRDGFTAEWRTPPDPAISRAAEPDVRDEDVLFEADRPATVHRDAKADCDGRCS